MSVHVVILATPRPEATEALAAYGAGVQPLLAAAGATVVFRGPVASTLAGGDPPASILVLAFEDSERAHAFFRDEAYRRLLPVREKAFARIEIFEVA